MFIISCIALREMIKKFSSENVREVVLGTKQNIPDFHLAVISEVLFYKCI